MNKQYYLIALFCLVFFSCNKNAKSIEQNTAKDAISVPSFNADSAYQYTKNQLDFGPRVPNTPAHQACGNYLADELRRFGADVVEQETTLYTYNNIALKAKNIIGSYNPESKNRILLFSHWDTRPFADQDPDPNNHRIPIDGANDGAGATGILLEMARQFNLQSPTIGIDIIFFDAEDWGAPEFEPNKNGGWCLGSEYWAKNPHIPNYKARYGILLDMVSAKNACFHKEYYSMYYAKDIVDKVWKAAEINGYGNFFIHKNGGAIQDDHIEVIKHLRIPCIDIIQYDPTSDTRFGSYWHTLNDNIDSLSKETMKAVGQTVLYTVYNEK